MPNLRRRRRILRRTREKLGDLAFAGYDYLRRQRAALREAVRERIAKLSARIKRQQTSGFRVIPRSEWGARAPKSVSHMSSDSSGMFVHHTVGGMPDSETGEKTEMRAIQRLHMDSNGWNDIGYSFVVAPSGRVYEGRGRNISGAHTEGFNSTAYGCAVMGNYENAVPTDAVLAALRWLRFSYLSVQDRPLRGHRDVNATACPGKNLYGRLGALR